MKINLFWRTMPVYICVVALFTLPLWQRNVAALKARQNIALYENSSLTPPEEEVSIGGDPKRIIIPRLGIDLDVVAGVYEGSAAQWTVSKNTANYAVNTAKNNSESGTTLIYGHWTPQVFGATKNLKEGDKVVVITENNHTFNYSYKTKKILQPSDTYLFEELPTDKPGLALMTCQGLWAQERRIMYFDLEDVK